MFRQFWVSTFQETFNVEIRKNPSNGCLDVFVIPNDLENSKIIMENLSGEGINIYQKNFEKYMQILENNQTQTLNNVFYLVLFILSICWQHFSKKLE